MENLVIIRLTADGYYSGSSVEECCILREDTFDKIKEKLFNKTFYFHELDGKHSETEGDLSIEIIDKSLLNTIFWDEINTSNDKLNETLIELFGITRCMFASNFPVDKVCASFDEIYGGFEKIVASFSEQEKDMLFRSNANRIYDMGLE